PWQLLGLLTLGVVVSDESVSRPVLVFSGTSLFVGGGLLLQTVVRYGSPVAVAMRARSDAVRSAPEERRAVPVRRVREPAPTAGAPRSPGSIPRSPCPA